MIKRVLVHIIFITFIFFFSLNVNAQSKNYEAFKDSLFYGPRVTSLQEVLVNLNTLIRTPSTDSKKVILYKIKKLHPLIELEQLNNALELTNELLNVVEKDLEVTVRIRRGLIYEFLGDFKKGKRELDIVKQLFENKNVVKNEEYGALLYRYASLYRVNGKNKEGLEYINKAIVFGTKNKYYDVTSVGYLVKALIVNENDNEAFKNLLLEGLKYARLSKNKFHIRSIYGNLARYYQRKEAYKTTLIYTDSILYYDKLLHLSFSGTRSYLIKSECYSALNKPELALKNFKIYHEKTKADRISKEALITKELEHKRYIDGEKIKRDKVFENNKEITEKNQNLTLFIISLIILFFVLIFTIILILKRNKIIKENKELIAISNKLLLKGLKEKEILLKEVHHRVKNNLMLIISLIDFQMLEIENKKHKTRYLSLKNRIEAIAILHEQMLIKADQGLDDNYNIKTYIDNIAKSLLSLHPKEVNFFNKVTPIEVNLDVAVPLGMLTNELISNSLKHNHNKKVNIDIKIAEQANYLYIVYSDSGNNFEIKNTKKKSMGLFIIESMVKQLKGTLKREETTYYIKIRKEK
jgi:two-component sensor histidine kinase